MFRFIRKLLRLIFREKGVYYIGSGEILPPPLTPEKERELVLNIMYEDISNANLDGYVWVKTNGRWTVNKIS